MQQNVHSLEQHGRAVEPSNSRLATVHAAALVYCDHAQNLRCRPPPVNNLASSLAIFVMKSVAEQDQVEDRAVRQIRYFLESAGRNHTIFRGKHGSPRRQETLIAAETKH